MDGTLNGARRWKVVGGASTGGIIVREGKDLKSIQFNDRLAHGALLQELALEGERLQYRKLAGEGPPEGWVSIRLPDKELVVPDVPEPEEKELAAEAAEPQQEPGLFQGEGRTLGGDAGHSAERLTPQEQRLRALEAAEKRQVTMPGISAKKSAELVQRRQKEELLEKLTAHYQARGEDLPTGLSVTTAVEKLRQHWERVQAAAAPEVVPKESPQETASARLARDMRGREEKDVGGHPPLARGREPQDWEPPSGGPIEGRQAAAGPSLPTSCPPASGSGVAVSRDLLACASGCGMKVATRIEFGGYCCIACSEGGDHGPRCERIPAPAGSVRADPNHWPVDGNKMEDLDLERAIMLSVQEASAPSQGGASASASAGPAGYEDLGRVQEDEDLAEAIRISMLLADDDDDDSGGEPLHKDKALETKDKPKKFVLDMCEPFNGQLPGWEDYQDNPFFMDMCAPPKQHEPFVLDLCHPLGNKADRDRSGGFVDTSEAFVRYPCARSPPMDPGIDISGIDFNDLYDDPLGSTDESDDEGPPPLEPLDAPCC